MAQCILVKMLRNPQQFKGLAFTDQEHLFQILNNLHTRSLYFSECCIAAKGVVERRDEACNGWPIPYAWARVGNVGT
jgi:hypothetical protein